jgi:DNA-binding CsgD family transcriptional regulator
VTLHRLWARGDSYQEIAAALGCSQSFVSRLKDRHKLANRQKATKDILADDPTPEEIAERAAECRARRVQPEPKGERVSVPRYMWDGFRFHGLT